MISLYNRPLFADTIELIYVALHETGSAVVAPIGFGTAMWLYTTPAPDRKYSEKASMLFDLPVYIKR